MERDKHRNYTTNTHPPSRSDRGSRLSDWKMRKKDGGIEREREMNRWSYQNALRLVFNLDTEKGREAQGERKMKRGRERQKEEEKDALY